MIFFRRSSVYVRAQVHASALRVNPLLGPHCAAHNGDDITCIGIQIGDCDRSNACACVCGPCVLHSRIGIRNRLMGRRGVFFSLASVCAVVRVYL